MGVGNEYFGALIGLRYLELDEQGSLSQTGAGVLTNFNTTVANRLYGAQFWYGAQFGTDATLLKGEIFD